MRVLSLFRERDQVLSTASVTLQQNQKELNQHRAQSKLLEDCRQALSQNNSETARYTSELTQKYQLIEQDLLKTFKEHESTISAQSLQLSQQSDTIGILEAEKAKATEDRNLERKARVEQEGRMKEFQQENERLKANYEILKEHEMSVIRDCENRKNAQISQTHDELVREKERYLQEKNNASELQREVLKLSEQIL